MLPRELRGSQQIARHNKGVPRHELVPGGYPRKRGSQARRGTFHPSHTPGALRLAPGVIQKISVRHPALMQRGNERAPRREAQPSMHSPNASSCRSPFFGFLRHDRNMREAVHLLLQALQVFCRLSARAEDCRGGQLCRSQPPGIFITCIWREENGSHHPFGVARRLIVVIFAHIEGLSCRSKRVRRPSKSRGPVRGVRSATFFSRGSPRNLRAESPAGRPAPRRLTTYGYRPLGHP